MGSPTERGLNSIFGTVYDHLTEIAGCSVLRLSTPHDSVHAPLPHLDIDHHHEHLSSVADDCLGARVELDNKTEAFEYMANKLAKALETDAESVLEALLKRERTQNTSIGRGVALPHATLAGIASTKLGVFTLKAPIDYQAVDGQLIDVLVVTLGPPKDRQAHLLLLAKVSKMLKQEAFLNALRAADNAAELRTILHGNFEDLS